MTLNIVWLRRDLRMGDNPALLNAASDGNPVLPLFILDEATQKSGSAFKWRLGLSLEELSKDFVKMNSRLVLFKGDPLTILDKLVSDLDCKKIYWNRQYDEDSIRRDTGIKLFFEKKGISVLSTEGSLLLSPWKVKTHSGSYYKVFTPFWRAYAKENIEKPLPTPSKINAPINFPKGDHLSDWQLDSGIGKAKRYLIKSMNVGEKKALSRLQTFMDVRLTQYNLSRDRVDMVDSSNLSENLAYGEISARQIWTSVCNLKDINSVSREMFIRQLAWRDFAWYLCFHCPHILKNNWKEEWKDFPWRDNSEALLRWQRGITGEPIVDAGMREMYITGRMHNRVRMIVASYLTKHLLIDWRRGLEWFQDCLVDWDPASNALGWQWVAGSGPDASPFFRVFNPELQSKKFDPKGIYRTKFLGSSLETTNESKAYYQMIPKSWEIKESNYPVTPIIDLKAGRDRALDAYSTFKGKNVSGVST
jgi:deoxyribodipyrimidine photo-lyase